MSEDPKQKPHEPTLVVRRDRESGEQPEDTWVGPEPISKEVTDTGIRIPAEPSDDEVYRSLDPIHAFGGEVESFGASVVSFWRSLVVAVKARVIAPVRDQAVATWSRLRGGKEFEQVGDDKFDRVRARKWESFNRGRTSSSYLQDTERQDR